MKSPFVNALTLFIGFCLVAILLVLLTTGLAESTSTIAKILFAPFMLDISRGVGDQGAQYFRFMTLASYLIVIGFVISRYLAEENTVKAILSALGILSTIAHFVVVGLGYYSTILH